MLASGEMMSVVFQSLFKKSEEEMISVVSIPV
jgi:hypothetical protein